METELGSLSWQREARDYAERIKVLIVDDQPRARKSLKALLSTCPRISEAHEASNGREAVQLVKELQPDVVLMDVRMPEMDGLNATRQIKALWPQVRVVVLSMYLEYRDEATAAGADAFAGKGDAPDALLDILTVVMQKAV
jgi:DNA-binding NarL/FixJ family response regulator